MATALLGMATAPIRGYVTGLLQTYLSKYIKDIQLEGECRLPPALPRGIKTAARARRGSHLRRPAASSPLSLAGLGVLGSDLVLNNLELRLEALQELVPTPLTFEFTRGYVRVS